MDLCGRMWSTGRWTMDDGRSMQIDGEEEEVESVWYGQRWRVPLEFIIKNAEIKGTNLLSASLFIVDCGLSWRNFVSIFTLVLSLHVVFAR